MSIRTLEVLCAAGIAFIIVFAITAAVQNSRKKSEPSYSQQCAALGGKVEEQTHLGPKAMVYTTRECVVTK